MSLLDKLEKHVRPYAVPNLSLLIVASQAIAWVLIKGKGLSPDILPLVPRLVLGGELWRVLTFVIMPPLGSPVGTFFAWYIFYMMGTALEHHWGSARYNLFLLIGYVATVAVSFLTPDYQASTAFLGTSVFLAFAFVAPNFELYIFFLLPVKMKWLALITWIGYGMALAKGPNSVRLLVLASVLNYLLFFGKDIVRRAQSGQKRMAVQAKQVAKSRQAFHTCAVCGATDQSHPQMEFRYCTECKPARGYCADHLADHEHVVES